MKRSRQAKRTTCCLLAGLLGSLAGCGSTREMGTTTPGPSSISAAQTIAAGDYATVRAGRPGMPVRSVTIAPLPVFHASSARPEREPAGLATAVPTRSPAPVAAPTRAAPRVLAKTTRTQSGRIIDEAGQPLVGATVLLKGTAKGASTDANGNYSLEVPAGTNTFVFGYSGYQDEVADGHDGQPLTVTLLPAAAPRETPRRKHQ